MKTKKVFYTLLTVALGHLVSARAADVSHYLITKGQDYVQTNATTVVSLTNDLPFRFSSSVDGTASNSILAASLKLPNLQVRTLTNDNGTFEFETGFTNKAALDAAYGAGNYIYNIVGATDGTNKPVLVLAVESFPPVPKISGWDDLQAVDAALPLTLSWGAFTNGTTNDFVRVSVRDAGGNGVFSTPDVSAINALNGTNLATEIPAATLNSDTAYEGSLLFFKRTTVTTNYPGAKGVAGYFRETKFPLMTQAGGDNRMQFSATAFSAGENSGSANILITRSSDVGTASVDLGTQEITALDGTDYQGVFQTVNFAEGVSSVNYAITLFDNFLLQSNKTLKVTLSNPQSSAGGASIGTRSNAVLTILDNEFAAAGRLQFATRSNVVAEAAKFITLTVTRLGGSTGTVTAEFFTSSADETAVPGLDYTSTNGTLIFGPGIITKTITVPIINNTVFTSSAVFHVALANPSGGAVLGTNTSTRVSIINDDLGGTLAFKQSNYVTNENSTNFLITVVRTGGLASGVTVDFNTVDGAAQAGVRYVATNGTLTFGSNELSKSFQVGVINDSLPNGDQSFAVQLSNATGGAKINTNNTARTAILLIKDDESSVAFTNTSFVVGEGVGTFTTTVFRTGALFTPATVDYFTSDLTTTAGLDYRATNGTLVFPAGVKSKTISVTISNDTLVEDNEVFSITLTNPTNVLLGVISSTDVTITNNDFGGTINFSTNNYTVSEGGTNAIITLVRSNGLASGVTVNFTTADGTALDGLNYSNVTQTVTFTNGETMKKIRVPIVNNTLVGGNTTVLLAIDSANGGGSLGSRTNALLTISEDDLAGRISFVKTNYSASENATNFYVNVIRTGGKAGSVTVDYATTGGTATSDVDFTSTNGTLIFAAGETNKIITIPIIQDTLIEGSESFTLSLGNPLGGATLANNLATLTILDDENSIAISNATAEVNEAAGKIVVTLVRSGVLTSPLTVHFATADGSATAGSDYGATNGTVSFPANVATKTITISIVNDTLAESDEDFTFTISNAQGGGVQLGTIQTQTITIHDKDTAGAIQFGAATFSGTEGGNASIRIIRTGGAASGVTVKFTMTDGTATSGLDYENKTGTLTFAAGETNKIILIPVLVDSLVESTETVNLTLDTPTGGATIGAQSTATLNLMDKPDVNGVPITGPVFMSATLGSTAVNITPNNTGNAVNGVASTGFKLQVNFVTGALLNSVLNIFDFEGIPFATGTTQMDNSGNTGIMLYTKSGITAVNPQSWAVANGSGSIGSRGTVTIDAIDTGTKTVSGRFTFHAVGDTGTVPLVLEITNGKFRTHYN